MSGENPTVEEKVVIIPVTANNDAQTREKCFAVGCNYFFAKPVN